MLFTQNKSAATKPRKLHSIHALLNERSFIGKIEAGSKAIDFAYTLQGATVSNGKLELTGRVLVKTPSTKIFAAENVKATLRGVQSAMASAQRPGSFKLTVPSAFAEATPSGTPLTEFTDGRSGLGVIYLALSALDGKALGIPFDMGEVQLNGRMTVADQTARDLQWLFNQIVAALESKQAGLAEPYVNEVDRILRM